MVLKIRIKNAWQRLYTKFDVEETLESEQAIIPKSVQPITSMDELLKLVYIEQIAAAVPRLAASGAGKFLLCRIPAGKRWTIYAVEAIRQAGDGTLTTLEVKMRPTGNPYVVVFTQVAAANLTTSLLTFPIVLEEDHGLYTYCDAITGDSNWNVVAYYSEEDAF